MSYVLAVDVGTSFTAAAVIRTDQNAPCVPESLPLGLRGTAVPSVVFYPEEGPILVGEAAERRGLDFPERVVREFKRRIGDSVPISVGNRSLPAENVFATMASWVADRAQEREGEPPSEIVLSHPASWGAHRTTLILNALASKGLHNVTLISEPEAAVRHYASQVRVEDGGTIAVYDLGGGTFDTAILRKAGAGHFELLGRPGGIDCLGGADFDTAVFRHVAEHTGAALAGLDPDAPATRAVLARLRRECVEAKETLSSDSEANISVLLPGIQQQVRLVRSEFEAMIEEGIRETVDALEGSLQDLGLCADDLTAVLLSGGSSRIPLVAQLISETLDRPIAVDADPKSSVCFGAAMASGRAQQAAQEDAGREAARFATAGTTTAQGTAAALDAAAGVAAPAAAAAAHSASRRAGWSRKPGTVPGSVPAAGTGSGFAAPGAGPGHRRHRGGKHGTHAKKPTARLSAVAAVAVLFLVLTATTAQSPGGLDTLTDMFIPQEAGAGTGSDPEKVSTGTTEAGSDGATGGTGAPQGGIEAKGQRPGDRTISVAVPEGAASPASMPSSGPSPQPAAGGALAGAASSTSLGDGGAAGAGGPSQDGGATTPMGSAITPAIPANPISVDPPLTTAPPPVNVAPPVPAPPAPAAPVRVAPSATVAPPDTVAPPVTVAPSATVAPPVAGVPPVTVAPNATLTVTAPELPSPAADLVPAIQPAA